MDAHPRRASLRCICAVTAPPLSALGPRPDQRPSRRPPLAPLSISYGIGVLGSVNVKRAVVAGQYHRPDGLYYGGQKLAVSHELLLPKLREVASPASAAILLDVHTGLGPAGVDTLVPQFKVGTAEQRANAAAIHTIFGRDESGGEVDT